MKYKSIGAAIAGAIDQTTRGMNDREYETHIKRLRRYGRKIEALEDYISVWADTPNAPEYQKGLADLATYKAKLEAEQNRGL